MKTMVVSEFKAKCIAVLREAQNSGESVIVTRRGQPIARIEPISSFPSERRLGALRGRMEIRDDFDLVHADTTEDWEFSG